MTVEIADEYRITSNVRRYEMRLMPCSDELQNERSQQIRSTVHNFSNHLCLQLAVIFYLCRRMLK